MIQHKWSLRLIRLAALLGLIGTILGAHMAGAGSYAFRAVHAHILVVGWLSMFAWGVFYKSFKTNATKLVNAQGWTGIIGSIGLTVGMWMQFVQPFGDIKAVNLIVYIGGGVILLISFTLFFIVTLTAKKDETT